MSRSIFGMSSRALSIAVLAAAIAFAASGTAAADEAATAGETAAQTAEAGDDARPAGAPDMNWVGENPDSTEEIMGDEAQPAIFMFINFAVFAGLLFFVGGPPLRRYLRSRHSVIKDALDEATKLREEAKGKLEEYGQRIADVDSEVDALVERVRADAEEEKERLIEEGRQQAERMKKDAESRIAAEFANARREIEREVVAAAVAAAERILRDKTTAEDKNALVDAFIADVESAREAAQGSSPEGGPS